MKTARILLTLALLVFFASPAMPAQNKADAEWRKLSVEFGGLYETGSYERATIVARKALDVAEKNFGQDHPATSASLANLALVYSAQGQYGQAEPLYKRALAIDEKIAGPDDPQVATDLNALGEVYRLSGRIAEAEPLFKRALAIDEKSLGPEHPDTAACLSNLGLLYATVQASTHGRSRSTNGRSRSPKKLSARSIHPWP